MSNLYMKTATGMVPMGNDGAYMTVTPWVAVTFFGTWINYSPTNGGDYQHVEYRQFGDKIEFRGLAINGSSGSLMFTLPVGFRPQKPINLAQSQSSNGATFDVQVSGNVICYWTSSSAVSLDGAFFSTTALGAMPAFSTPPDGSGTGLPPGGTIGQTVRKNSIIDGDAGWTDEVLVGNPSSPPAGLGIGQLLWDGQTTMVTPSRTVMGSATKTSTQTGFVGSLADISTLDITRTVVPTNYYELELFNIGGYSTVANDVMGIYLLAGGTQIAQVNFQIFGSGQVNAAPVCKAIFTGYTGNITFKAQAIRNAGTGTLSVYSAVGWRPQLVLKDLGPA